MDKPKSKNIEDIKCAIEAILFMSPRSIPIKKLEKSFPEADKETIKIIIADLLEEYEKRNTSIKIIVDEDSAEMLLKPEFAKYSLFAVGKQLTKSELNTLALIALNSPVEQYKITKRRPIDHLPTLKELGLIQVYKKGRKNILETTKKFDVLYNKKIKPSFEQKKIN
ncbi:MAG: SMC-Scp complex subunit ScpB [archaeon]|jgi:chromosome segregation and condensation protein ScpB